MRFMTKLFLTTLGLFEALNSFASYTWTAQYTGSNGNVVKKVTSPNATTTYSYRQGFGEPILLNKTRQSISNTGFYDNEGRLLSLSQAGESRNYNYTEYAHLSWLISQSDPELGTTNYSYYSNGQRKTEQIVGSTSTTFRYDANGNTTQVDYTSANGIPASPTITYEYDANNNVISKSLGGDNQINNTYDALNHLLKSSLKYSYPDGTTQKDISYKYDGYGHIGYIIYPDRLIINYNINGFGRSKSITSSLDSIITDITYNSANNITSYAGANFSLSIAYDNMNRVTDIKTTSIKSSYTYDGENNVISIIDGLSSSNNESFSYDNNNRLVQASGPWGQASYSYDNLNNITSLITTNDGAHSYVYDGKNLLNFVTSNKSGVQNLDYDTNGNVIKKGQDTYVYDAANHLISFKNKDHKIDFVYDPNGHVISTTEDGKKPVITYYDESGKLLYKLDPNKATEQVTDYIYLNGKLAVEARHDNGDLKNVSYHYITTNPLGSPVASTLNGVTEWRQVYRPYGLEKSQITQDDDHIGFTGKETVKNMNLVNMNARYYAPDFGRFMAYDPAEPTVGDLFSFNRYAYANNNPLLYTDPTGLFSFSDFLNGANNFASGIINGMSAGFVNTEHTQGFAHDAGWAFGTALGLTYGATELRAARYAASKAGGLLESSTTTAMKERNLAGQADVAKAVKGIEYDSKGKVISREPKSLRDKLTMEEAKTEKYSSDETPKGGLNDPKYKGMYKRRYSRNFSNGTRTDIHYVEDPINGGRYDFKFKNHAED
ncbi:RHS repeat-associated core domain-containing protein [Allofrancisella guangzhouensis]|uniref:Teneurin-like YD-shell domain-containing protein n=1 Tax=Allofrancisella guangzhouensis TaxID=594679 RepID=A0A0A8E3B2_9GAMM|nr:RHS repeat-associated core domain-containing protein [Allofrancisella guangzhouensis]AJC48493.1 hypothetical protein SD28_01905 [Allofrancisella guangzhouensis]MBK2028027.1 RHS repeat-associated core domain-containing protein [Allofrancisella guangzhouensis]MBK2044085.1 RHS repeat-associated core domain-containing protein [Allofrancisella guangzhouensis]MBK2046533.1 RHS repeat-associated core domain-containing protein [Allofrancisella guangzhouensis]